MTKPEVLVIAGAGQLRVGIPGHYGQFDTCETFAEAINAARRRLEDGHARAFVAFRIDAAYAEPAGMGDGSEREILRFEVYPDRVALVPQNQGGLSDEQREAAMRIDSDRLRGWRARSNAYLGLAPNDPTPAHLGGSLDDPRRLTDRGASFGRAPFKGQEARASLFADAAPERTIRPSLDSSAVCPGCSLRDELVRANNSDSPTRLYCRRCNVTFEPEAS